MDFATDLIDATEIMLNMEFTIDLCPEKGEKKTRKTRMKRSKIAIEKVQKSNQGRICLCTCEGGESAAMAFTPGGTWKQRWSLTVGKKEGRGKQQGRKDFLFIVSQRINCWEIPDHRK